MFTEQVQELLEQAKADAVLRGLEEIGLDSLLAAAAQQPEARALLARCLDLGPGGLREKYAAAPPEATMFAERLALSPPLRDALQKARALAQEVPDRLHPGLIAVRHLVCGLAQSDVLGGLLDVAPITEEGAVELLSAWYEGDASTPVLGELSEQLRSLRAKLSSQVFGQDHAVHAFAEGMFNAEVTAQADTTRKRPKAIFAFAGPPGVGKTYLAELVAAGLDRPFKRFDMSSYSDHQQHMQLVGFPPSYKGAQAGTLTGFVAENPDAFLLFDEIEKAHLNTIHLFLQILDGGRLEDQFTGEAVAFRDTVIILTTNAGRSLYERPNETGVNAANSTFHRRTILDALRTETGAGGKPFFPAAICSRLATGYPVLFNHLGVNELERIARTELQRVGGLVEQQYYKAVTFDELLPLTLVLREGAKTDARTVNSQSGAFLRTELFKFSELYSGRRMEQVLEEVDTIHLGVEQRETEDAGVARLFQPPGKPKVLLVGAKPLGILCQRHIAEVDWLAVSSGADVLQALATVEVDMVLLDVWLGREADALTGTLAGTIGQFDHAPVAARALSEGQEVLSAVHQRLPHLPVYLLSLAGIDGGQGSVDEQLFLACVRGGGARGVVSTAFVSDLLDGWQAARDAFAAQLQAISLKMYREKMARELGQERKILAFDTAPAVDRTGRQIKIRLRNLRLSRAVAAEDAGEILDDVERPGARFSDVFGAEAAKEALQFVVKWLQNPRHYAALGVSPPRGILLTGPPGTGKTFLARALAGESDVSFLVASGTDFVTIWQGSGPQNVRDLFERARRYAPSILFIDEIDAVGKKRVGMGSGGRAEESTLNALLTEMDGFGAPTMRPVIILAATNLAEHLDDALQRRFDRIIEVPPPDRDARLAYLRKELMGRDLSQVSEAVAETLAGRSTGMTIANLRRIVNEAAVMAARAASPLTDAIVEEAFEKMRMGEAHDAPDFSTLERIARHEAGHALVGWRTGSRPVQVTIVGRGGAGGYVEKEVDEGKIIYTRTELENLICQAMGGRAAELLYYGETDGLSTGVGSDLKNASAWAERMIREFGMSDEVGQIYLDPRSLRDGPLAARVSEGAEGIVRSQLDRAVTLLETQSQSLEQLSEELLRRNRLTRADLEAILGDGNPTQPDAPAAL